VVDIPPADPPAAAAGLWAGLDGPWQEAFRQAWEALRTGNIAVGACASTTDGQLVYAARNRVTDGAGPPGEIFGSSLAHAEMNVLARLPFGHRRDLVLTTTLLPCLQCAGAIRLGPISTVRFAGPDRYWDGCHEFGKLSAREAQRPGPARIGPYCDELGTFATLISRFGPTLTGPRFEHALRALGEGPLIDLVHELEDGGELKRLTALEVNEALGYLWPRLRDLIEILPALTREAEDPDMVDPGQTDVRKVTAADLIDEAVTWGIRRRAASSVVADTLDQVLAAIPATPGDARVLAVIREQAERISRG
jgi:tRNA(adenine34) deaminase